MKRFKQCRGESSDSPKGEPKGSPLRFGLLLALALATTILALVPSFAEAAVPKLINFQGVLKDGSGNPVANSSYFATFRIYDAPTGGTVLWADTQTVATSAGLFNAVLGAGAPVPDTVFNDTTRYLGITVFPDPEMIPRQRLISVGYGYRVSTVDGASGGTITSKVSIGPGHTNTGTDAFVAGANNQARGNYSVVSGGGGGALEVDSNSAIGNYSAIGGGLRNTASGSASAIGGGGGHVASGTGATVGGGNFNTASGFRSIVGGGSLNKARGDYSVVSGGGGGIDVDSNAALGDWSVVGGGLRNTASGQLATIGGGGINMVSGENATVGGGVGNTANGYSATVGGGAFNTASVSWATVSGGLSNNASGFHATVSGGFSNWATNEHATIGGGSYNLARGLYSVVAGGGGGSFADSNSALGNYSSVGGGQSNTAGGVYSTVPGGWNCSAAGNYSFAAGRRAKANHLGSFVWADSSVDADFASTAANQFLIRAAGGVGIGTDNPLSLLHLKGSNYKMLLESSGNVDVVVGRADTTRYGNYILANGDPSVGINNRWAIGLRNGDSKLHLYDEQNSLNVMVLQQGGRVGVGTSTPQGALDVNSTTGAFIVPRMTTVQRNALTAVNGMIIYNTDAVAGGRFEFRENGAWVTK